MIYTFNSKVPSDEEIVRLKNIIDSIIDYLQKEYPNIVAYNNSFIPKTSDEWTKISVKQCMEQMGIVESQGVVQTQLETENTGSYPYNNLFYAVDFPGNRDLGDNADVGDYKYYGKFILGQYGDYASGVKYNERYITVNKNAYANNEITFSKNDLNDIEKGVAYNVINQVLIT